MAPVKRPRSVSDAIDAAIAAEIRKTREFKRDLDYKTAMGSVKKKKENK